MSHCSLEEMVDLSGMVMWILFVVGIQLVHVDYTVRKWLVVPEPRSVWLLSLLYIS